VKASFFGFPFVAPRAGAWIEISKNNGFFRRAIWSPLAQGRGLKFIEKNNSICRYGWSPLAQGRGLKYRLHFAMLVKQRVAPRAGAWIEMDKMQLCFLSLFCRPSRRGVD